jgi:hypothetical protein
MPAMVAPSVVAAALVWAFGCGVAVQDGGTDNSPVFQICAVDGSRQRGPLGELRSDGSLTLADKPAALPLRQWLTLRRDKTALPAYPAGHQVVFANGDRVQLAEGERVRLLDNRLRFRPLGPVQLKGDFITPPLATVALLWLGGPDDAEEPALLVRQLVAARVKKDTVLLRNGERLEGVVLAIDSAEGCRVEAGKRQVEVPWAQVAAIAFNSALQHIEVPAEPYFHVVLTTGSRLALAKLQLAEGSANFEGKTLGGDAVQVALDKVIAVDVRGGAAVYLSDLKPLKYEHTPFLGTAWPLVKDGAVTGRELRLGESTYDKGLGCHSECRISYKLAGKYRWFEAQVGLDPQSGQRGRARVRVLVDGQECELGWKKELTLADGALPLRLEVIKGQELTLEVLFGTTGDVEAHINWVDARLIE